VYNDSKSKENLSLASDNYSPIQFINQIKGYFYVNPFIAISLAITLFSFVGIPPIIGFFAKQMILSAAIDSGYVFMALIAILTSVIGAGYYLNLIKQIFFYKNDYVINPKLNDISVRLHSESNTLENLTTKPNNVIISSSFSSVISILTLLLLLFIYIPEE
jgi:NADH-ubiquinone oxidoreductase chain 2